MNSESGVIDASSCRFDEAVALVEEFEHALAALEIDGARRQLEPPARPAPAARPEFFLMRALSAFVIFMQVSHACFGETCGARRIALTQVVPPRQPEAGRIECQVDDQRPVD